MRGDVDDPSPFGTPQQGERAAHAADRGHQPEVEGGPPVAVAELLEPPRPRAEGVDQDVERGPALPQLPEGVLDPVRVAEVDRESERVLAPYPVQRGLTAAMRDLLRTEPLATLDYVELVDADTLEQVTRLRGTCLALLAVRIGSVRLIDNMLIEERDSAFLVTL